MNNDDQNRYSPTQELQQRLQRASGSKAQLTVLMDHLPQIVEISPSEALGFAGKAERAATELQDWNAYVAAMMHRARAHMLLNNPREAIKALEPARDYLGEQEESTMAVRVAMARGHALSMLGNLEQATQEYQVALDLCGTEETDLLADVLQGLADFHLSTGHYDKAIEFLRKAIAIYTELGLDTGRGQALGAIGAAYGKMDDLAASYDYQQQSLEAFRAADDIANQGRTLANLASIQQKRGELNDALELAWKAYVASEECDDSMTTGAVMITIGDLHRQQEESDLAKEYYLEAHEHLQKHPPNDVLLSLYGRIGQIHEGINDLDAALLVYRHAIAIAEMIGECQVRSELHNALSFVLERMGNHSDALKHCRQYAQLQQELAKEEQRKKIDDLQRKHDMQEMKRKYADMQHRVQELEKEGKLNTWVATQDLLNGTSNARKDSVRNKKRKHLEIGSEKSSLDVAAPPPPTELMWEALRFDIDRAHPGFSDRLFAIAPDLTMTEKKICLLTKHLGNDTAQIARILDNTVRTLQTQRLKIRKKLGLGGDVNFVTYIDSI